MTQSDDSTTDEQPVFTDGGTDAQAAHENTNYLEHEVNIFKPSTPFMKDNVRMILLLFAAWIIGVFGPVFASYFAEGFMTETTVLGGYPLNFFLTALISPLIALMLAAVYAWYRDRLDSKYGITHGEEADETSETAVSADGGEVVLEEADNELDEARPSQQGEKP